MPPRGGRRASLSWATRARRSPARARQAVRSEDEVGIGCLHRPVRGARRRASVLSSTWAERLARGRVATYQHKRQERMVHISIANTGSDLYAFYLARP